MCSMTWNEITASNSPSAKGSGGTAVCRNRHAGLPEQLTSRKVFVHRDETCGLRRHGLDAVARTGADFQHLAPMRSAAAW